MNDMVFGERRAEGRLTGEIPRLALVEVNVNHHRKAPAAAVGSLGGEVVADELLISGVEPESWRQPLLHHPQEAHLSGAGREREREREREGG
ncbi:unnamed protein product [Spirodela intermedia]|uniref:Uncharacterized protein n=1 Tax=Spirodela intermedia TaxID=51605 RepID=A0A7I8L6B2_SPIIN|nr:unnamed protein product [Spirodela intermedia]